MDGRENMQTIVWPMPRGEVEAGVLARNEPYARVGRHPRNYNGEIVKKLHSRLPGSMASGRCGSMTYGQRRTVKEVRSRRCESKRFEPNRRAAKG